MVHAPRDSGRGEHIAQASSPYLRRVSELLAQWSLLCGMDDATGTLREITARLLDLPPAADWRAFSQLCADGAPIEFCETLACGQHGPAYTCDLGPFSADDRLRMTAALDMAAQLTGYDSVCEAFCGELRERVIEQLAAGIPLAGWLGIEHSPDGGRKCKLYIGVRGQPNVDAQRALQELATIAARPGAAAEMVLSDLAECGYVRMAAFTFAAGGIKSVKLYHRLRQIDGALLAGCAALADVPSQPFEVYLRSCLAVPQLWRDTRAGLALGWEGTGEVGEMALYHYTWPYFADDADLRARVLRYAPRWNWNETHYRLSSRLIRSEQQPRLRRLLGFGVKVDGGTQLHLYSSSGYLA